MTESADLLRDAWLSLEGQSGPAAEMQRISLEMAAEQSPQLRDVLTELKAPLQAELDLHLTGPSIVGHEAVAESFGRLVTRMSTAVKEIAKAASGRRRYSANLRVLAPAAGSVRLVLRAPEVRQVGNVIPGDAVADSVDSLALKRLAAVLGQADEAVHGDVEDSPLTASVRPLPASARQTLRLIAQTVEDANWWLEGELRQRGHMPSPLSLSPAGASYLIDVLRAEIIETQEDPPITGVIDGQRRSLSAMWFQPDRGRSFEAAVLDPELLVLVAELAAHQTPVRCTFRVFISYGPSDSAHARRSYELLRVEPASQDGQIELSLE